VSSAAAEKIAHEEKKRSNLSRCDVIRLPKYLTEEDISTIYGVQQRYRSAHGEPHPKRAFWLTTYLSTASVDAPDGMFRHVAPELFEKICALRHSVDPRCGSSPAELEDLRVRCIELHAYARGGGGLDPKHYDSGSVVTVDLMLDDDFEGGLFQTHCADTGTMTSHQFERGDALVFPSGKYHSVQEVTGGGRKVLILEFWTGVERHCNHRCGEKEGHCGHSPSSLEHLWYLPPMENTYYD